MNLESIVPPLELCKLIPAGSFADSALVWSYYDDEIELGTWIVERENDNNESDLGNDGQTKISAPTLAEIMAKIDQFQLTKGNYGNRRKIYFIGTAKTEDESDHNPATAALRLWLKLKADQ